MATRLDGIQNYLQRIRPQQSPLDTEMMARSLKSSPPIIKADGTYADAGLFGGPATLPSGSSPVDPPILTGANLPNSAFTGPLPQPTTPWTTRLDPNMGYINPSITVSGGGPNSSNPPAPSFPSGISFGPGGQLQGGASGPQGSVYGTDPNTGNPIYNVTGSPKPGFFDSKTGKFVETLGSMGLNMFVPGLGFVSRAVFDAIRNGQIARNTGTDLSGRGNTQANTVAAPQGPPPGYGKSWGLSAFTAPMDATTKAYLLGGGYAGAPNSMRGVPEEGRNRFDPSSGFTGHMDTESGILNRRQSVIDPVLKAQWDATPRETSAAATARQLAGLQQRFNPPPVDSNVNPFLAAYQEWIARRSALPVAPPIQVQPGGG